MSNTAAYYTTKLANIDAAIDKLLTDPRPNYKVGNTTMNYGDLLDKLEMARKTCLQALNSMQPEGFENLFNEVNVFGQDIADYLNEANA